jgi:hypothetical protein
MEERKKYGYLYKDDRLSICIESWTKDGVLVVKFEDETYLQFALPPKNNNDNVISLKKYKNRHRSN